MNKVVQRTCTGCNMKKDKKELIRIVFDKNENISVDETGKLPGRGAYICDSMECLEKAIKTKRLEKTLKTKINEKIYNDIRGVMIGRTDKKRG